MTTYFKEIVKYEKVLNYAKKIKLPAEIQYLIF